MEIKKLYNIEIIQYRNYTIKKLYNIEIILFIS